PGSTVTLRVDAQPAGSAMTPADGLFAVTTDSLPDGTHTVTAIASAGATGGDSSAASLARTVTIDTVAPSVVATTDPTGGRELRLAFNEAVAPLSVADLTLVNRVTTAAIPPGSIAVNTTPDAAVVTFPGYGAGALPA